MNTTAELKRHIKEQDKEIFDLIAKVIEVVANHDLWRNDEYTFDNGETWRRFDPESEIAKNTGKLEESDND